MPTPIIQSNQIAIDPRNGLLYYKDESGNLISASLNWKEQETSSEITTDRNTVTLSHDLIVNGNLTVNGDTATISAQTVTIEDNILLLNSNVSATPSTNAGIEVERGISNNVSLRWNESNDRWEVTSDGTTYYEVLTTGSTTFPASVVTLTDTQTLTNKTLTTPVITGVSPTITLSGDLSGSVTLTDLGNATLNATVINNSVALGTDTTGEYVSRLAAGSGITVSNNSGESATPNISIDTSIVQTRVADISDTEIGYLNGVTSAIQTQLDSKAPTSGPTFTGTTTLPSTTSIGNVSDTEIGYLDGVTSAIQTQLNNKPLIVPLTNKVYIDYLRADSYTATGTREYPYKTLAAAYTAAAAVVSSTNPMVLVLLSGNTLATAENITFAKGHLFLTAENSSGTHAPIIFYGSLTFAGPNTTISENHFSVSNIQMIGVSGTPPITFSGSYPQRLFIKDTWITAEGSAHGITMTNTGASSSVHTNDSKFSHNGSGHYHCIHIAAGTANLDSIETSGAGVGVIGVDGGTCNLSNSEITSGGTYAIDVYAGGSLTTANCKIVTTAANSSGIKLNTATAYAVLGNTFFNVPTSASTGRAIYGVTGTALYYSNLTFSPGSNVQIDSAITKTQIDDFGGPKATYTAAAAYTDSSISSVVSALNLKANSATPTFTGMTTVAKITVGGIEVDTTSPSDTHVLKYNSALNKYLPGVATVVAAIDDLTDVNAPAPSSDQVLSWDTPTSRWVNKTFSAVVNAIDAIGDVTAPSPSSGDYLKWSGSAWINDSVDLGTDTNGNYISGVTAGTGVAITHTPGEGSTPTFAIGQSVATSAVPTFAGLNLTQNGVLIFEGATDDTFETTLSVIDPTADRTINLPDISGTVITTGDTGTVTSTMIANGTIVNDDINASAAIVYSKLSLSNSVDYTDLKDGVAKAGFRSTINNKASGDLTTNNYTLLSSDLAKLVTVDNGATNASVTIPLSFLSEGDKIDVLNKGTGILSIKIASGGTLVCTPQGTANQANLRARYSSATLIKLDSSNTWLVIGDLQA